MSYRTYHIGAAECTRAVHTVYTYLSHCNRHCQDHWPTSVLSVIAELWQLLIHLRLIGAVLLSRNSCAPVHHIVRTLVIGANKRARGSWLIILSELHSSPSDHVRHSSAFLKNVTTFSHVTNNMTATRGLALLYVCLYDTRNNQLWLDFRCQRKASWPQFP